MKIGYHRIVIDGQTYEGPVVCEITDGRLVAWHKLQGEEAATVWRGGTLHCSELLVVNYEC